MTERKKIDGKSFIKALDDCKGKDEVLGLLYKTMGAEKMKDRAKNVSNIDSVVKLDARVAMLNTMRGNDTSNQNCMAMAAVKYINLTGKDVKSFKAEVNKFATRKEMENAMGSQDRTQDVNVKNAVTDFSL